MTAPVSARGERAVLWDLDGTLVDSTELHWIAWRDAMAAEGVPITREMFEATCSNCGKTAMVPFRPTSGKPVYCDDCFQSRRA